MGRFFWQHSPGWVGDAVWRSVSSTYGWKTLTKEAPSPSPPLRQPEKQGLGPRPPLPLPRRFHGPRANSMVQGAASAPWPLSHTFRYIPLATSVQLRAAAKLGSWDVDSHQGYRTLRPGPLCAESQLLQGKWDSPQNSVPQRDILCFTWCRSGLERVGGPGSAEPL